MNLFFSYSRIQKVEVKDLVDFLSIYHKCWFDSQIGAGAEWWNEILSQIRSCDVFIFVLSNNSNSSKACLAELNYADALGKYMVILKVDDISETFITPILKDRNITPYLSIDNARKNILARSIKDIEDSGKHQCKINMDVPAPPIPISDLSTIHSEIMTTNLMTEDEQISILSRIEKLMDKNAEKIEDIQLLLRDFENRDDITRFVGKKIDALLAIDQKNEAQEINKDKEEDIIPTNDFGVLRDIKTIIGKHSEDVAITNRLKNQLHNPTFLFGRWKRVRSVQNYQSVPVPANENIIFNNNYSFQVLQNNMQTNFGSFMFDFEYLTITFMNGMMDTRCYQCFQQELYIVQYMNYAPFLIDCYHRV